jgi:hypothetical protein
MLDINRACWRRGWWKPSHFATDGAGLRFQIFFRDGQIIFKVKATRWGYGVRQRGDGFVSDRASSGRYCQEPTCRQRWMDGRYIGTATIVHLHSFVIATYTTNAPRRVGRVQYGLARRVTELIAGGNREAMYWNEGG